MKSNQITSLHNTCDATNTCKSIEPSQSQACQQVDRKASEQTCDEKDNGGDESSHSPAVLFEDRAGEQHHHKGDSTSRRGEVSHERRVLVRVGKLSLDLALPGYLNQVDTDTICHHLQGTTAQFCVRTGCFSAAGPCSPITQPTFLHRQYMLSLLQVDQISILVPYKTADTQALHTVTTDRGMSRLLLTSQALTNVARSLM